jgi:hypothetical protein
MTTTKIEGWMPLLQYRDQVFLTNMRVPLRCGDRCMSKEFLYHTNIDAILKKQCRHRMAQHVRGYMSLDSGLTPQLSDYVCNALGRKSLSRGVEEERSAFGLDLCPGPEVFLLNLQALLVDGKTKARTSSFALYFEHALSLEEI